MTNDNPNILIDFITAIRDDVLDRFAKDNGFPGLVEWKIKPIPPGDSVVLLYYQEDIARQVLERHHTRLKAQHSNCPDAKPSYGIGWGTYPNPIGP